ncbi:MAG: formylglycine-generating enzyme family protein [Pedosphaera sp.]|nr:formylglycine-generating enzyme family protein [Pedosphaera sp.]MSU44369.1 formylglycine-generating enzyme family protein [Pedosphaera sp.]
MVWIPAGTFKMGAEEGETDERPVHAITLDGFWMDKHEVTNEQFAKFVEKAGYLTVAEKMPDPKLFPGVPLENLKAGSVVFTPPKEAIPLAELRGHNAFLQWWKYVPGASWRHPEGPGSTLRGREKHPAVHISWEDAAAYAKWAGKQLPTEAQWEFAARGGLAGKEYVWGDKFEPDGKPMANIWQGQFPVENTQRDGFRGTSPAGSFPANGYGLHDMAGNVWEWCQDWYTPNYYKTSPAKNPAGPDTSNDPNEPGVWKRVQRGGSFMCTDLYCGAFRPSRRMKTSPDTGLSHAGFRCVGIGFPAAPDSIKPQK